MADPNLSKYYGFLSVTRPDGNSPGSWYRYACGHCGAMTNGAVLAIYNGNQWLMCTGCAKGSVLTAEGALFPSPPFGPTLEGIPEVVNNAYEEARRCYSISALTACELICRKILMHVAVDKGAKEGEPFQFYTTFLEGDGYVTPPIKKWLDVIRTTGNEATHTLQPRDRKRTESSLMFTAELLRLVYEMEHFANQYT